jgi:hypothetical protein
MSGSPITGRQPVRATLTESTEAGDIDIEDINEDSQEAKERRCRKRSTAVNSIKGKEEYKVVDRLRREGSLVSLLESGVIKRIPRTPDAQNIDDTSKRTWEKAVQEWRADLRCVNQAVQGQRHLVMV